MIKSSMVHSYFEDTGNMNGEIVGTAAKGWGLRHKDIAKPDRKQYAAPSG